MMRTVLGLLAVLIALPASPGRGALGYAAASARQASRQERPTFRTGTRTVAMYATVNDAEGRLVTDLDRSAFTVFDNGRPVELTVFSNEVQRITAAVMLDMSGSMSNKVARVREAAERFIHAIVPGDRACIGTFGRDVVVSAGPTDDGQALERALREKLTPGGETPLWRALLTAMDALMGERGRRVVLVLTDGADSDPLPSPPKAKDVKARAVREGFMVYAIGLEHTRGDLVDERATQPDSRKGPPKVASGTPAQWSSSDWMFSGGLTSAMIDVVRETGGGHFEMKPGMDLGDTFARVGDELRHQYLLAFSPASTDGKLHKLEVVVSRPGCQVRARKSYVAGDER